MPDMPDDFVELVTERYIELYEIITGETFEKKRSSDLLNDIENAIMTNI